VAIAVENLTHRYGDRVALSGVSFQVAPKTIFGLLGPNGGGKSTLFRILATMMEATSGTARVAGYDVGTRPHEVRRRLGVVFQSHSLDKKLTVSENLVAQGHMYGLTGARLRERMEAMLSRLGLADRRGDIVQTLSGGLMRRVEIAKALLHEPEVLLMDEPSTGLDPGVRRELMDYIHDLRTRQGLTVLLTTHILEEAERCDRLLLLHRGRAVIEGAPADLKSRVGGDVVVLESREMDALRRGIEEKFRLRPVVNDGVMRIEAEGAHRLVPELFEAFPGAIRSIAVHRPTLEDVFLNETGENISA